MRAALLCTAVLLAACARADDGATDTATPVAAAPATPAPLALADIAGVWDVKGTNMAGDSTIITYTVNATADTSGWTLTFPGRQPIPLRVVTVAGDSAVVEGGPFESALRRGVRVRTSSVMRMQDGKLIGHNTSRYLNVKTADSVVMMRSEGTRRP